MGSTKASCQNRFMRIITIPIRVLSKVKDFYVKSMNDCAEKVGSGNLMSAAAAGHLSTMPKSFGVSSSWSNDDELIRTPSSRSNDNNIYNMVDNNMDLSMQQQMRESRRVPRSCSVAMGKIDEDNPCDFEEESTINLKSELVYPRSRTYVVNKRSVAFD